jgi:hypothetical protein
MHLGTSELIQIKIALLDRAKMFYRMAYSAKHSGTHGEDFLDTAAGIQGTIEYIDIELERRGW